MLENEATSFSTGQMENTVFTSKSLHPSLLMTMFEFFFSNYYHNGFICLYHISAANPKSIDGGLHAYYNIFSGL